MSHDIIAPSGLDITVQCPRSVGLQMGLPDLPTEESMEGDAAHWLAMMTANGIPMPIGTPCPNGVLVDQDMIDGAELWADIVGPYGEAERKVRIIRIHPRHCGGTPDNYRHDPIAQTCACLTTNTAIASSKCSRTNSSPRMRRASSTS
jgi:hypothetical protein